MNSGPPDRPRPGVDGVVLRALCFVFATLPLILTALLGVMWVLERGPTETATKLFVLSVLCPASAVWDRHSWRWPAV